jgi:hypothetical protein
VPTVPIYEPQVAPTVDRNLPQVKAADYGGSGLGVGLREAAQAVESYAKVKDAVADNVDEARARGAFNRYVARSDQVLHSGPAAFLTLQGRAAVEARALAEQELQDAHGQALSEAKTPRERMYIENSLTPRVDMDLKNVGFHALGQGIKYNIDETTARTAVLAADAARGYTSPDLVDANLATIHAEVTKLGELQGWGNDQVEAKRLELTSNVRREVGTRFVYDGPQGPQVAAQYAKDHASDLTPEDADKLQSHIRSQQSTLDAEARRQEAEARSQAAHALTLFKEQWRTKIEDVHAGVDVDPGSLAQAADQAEKLGAGDLAHDLRNASAAALVTAKFGPASQGDREAALHGIEQSKDWQKDPAKVAAHSQIQTLMDRDRQAADNDKLSLWSRNGGHLTPFNLGDPAAVKARIAEARGAQARYGGELQLLTEQEAKPLREAFDKGKPAEKAGIVETLSTYGGETAKAMLRQIAPLQPQYAALADLAGMRNRQAGRQLARDALNGWEEIKANKHLIAGADEKTIQETLDDPRNGYTAATVMLDPVTRQGLMEVARGIYATRAARAGKAGSLDTELWKQSYEAALGAAGDGTGGLARAATGERYILPRGGTQRDFEAVMWQADPAKFRAASGDDVPVWSGRPMSLGEIRKQVTPVAVADGIYAFKSKGGGFVTSAKHPGANYLLDLRALARSIGH